jgi:hypothetical protein
MMVNLLASAACGLATVNVEVLASNESGPFQVQDPFDDIVNFPDTAQRVKGSEGLVAFWVLQRGLDDAKGNYVYSHPAGRVFHGQRPGHSRQNRPL